MVINAVSLTTIRVEKEQRISWAIRYGGLESEFFEVLHKPAVGSL